MSEKVYVPRCYIKEVDGKFGAFLSVTFKSKELLDFVRTNTDEKGNFKINISRRREVDQYGNSHYATLDNYKPNQSAQTQTPGGAPSSKGAPPSDYEEPSDVPF